MRTRHPHPGQPAGHTPSRHGRRLLVASAAALLAGLAAVVGVWQLVLRSGHTPGEWLDYVDRRLEGHVKLVWIAHPVMDGLRGFLDAPSASDRARHPFVVPSPPPRRTASQIPPADPLPAGAKVWHIQPDGPMRIGDVARLARDGDVVEIEAGDYRGDVAVWAQTRLTIRGVNGAARLFADGRSAEDKAIWVIRKGDFDVANVDFIGARVSDRNGAGIRFESGRLRLRHCLFWGNEMGLLTAGSQLADDTQLTIESSEFAYSSVPGRWGHNLYVGTIDRLTVVGSYFHHAGVGHLLKSRARVNDIRYSRLTDESGGRASYELEFPNGGIVTLLGNIVQQGRTTEHSTMIAMGREGYRWPENRLSMASNTLVNDHPHGGSFLTVAPGAQRVASANNLLVGPGVFRVEAPMTSFNDVPTDWEDLSRPARYDYRLAHAGRRLEYRLPADLGVNDLVPDSEYQHERRRARLAASPSRVGALQGEAD